MRLSRRELLVAMGLSACDLRPDVPAAAGFPLGVASGDVRSTSANLWTRYEGAAPLDVSWWPLSAPAEVQQQRVTPRSNGTVLVEVTGLQPGTRYGYRFGDGTLSSDEGEFRAAIAEGSLEPLVFGAYSCARQTSSLKPLEALAAERLDAYFCLGDAVYTDGADDQASYDLKWQSGLVREPNRRLRGSASGVMTWDDHELKNDFSADRIAPGQLTFARDALLSHQPVRPMAPDRIWRSLGWGKTAEVFVLDSRGERNHDRREYVSNAQLEWLMHGLATSEATFKLVLNSVPISEYPGAFFQAFKDDRWEGFPEQRRRLLEHVDANCRGVVWLAGDFHIGVAGRVSLSGPGRNQIELASGPAGCDVPNPSPTYPGKPQFDFCTAVPNGLVLGLNPQRRELSARYVAGDRRVLFEKTYGV